MRISPNTGSAVLALSAMLLALAGCDRRDTTSSPSTQPSATTSTPTTPMPPASAASR